MTFHNLNNRHHLTQTETNELSLSSAAHRREKIAKQTEEYLAKGKKITVVPEDPETAERVRLTPAPRIAWGELE